MGQLAMLGLARKEVALGLGAGRDLGAGQRAAAACARSLMTTQKIGGNAGGSRGAELGDERSSEGLGEGSDEGKDSGEDRCELGL